MNEKRKTPVPAFQLSTTAPTRRVIPVKKDPAPNPPATPGTKSKPAKTENSKPEAAEEKPKTT